MFKNWDIFDWKIMREIWKARWYTLLQWMCTCLRPLICYSHVSGPLTLILLTWRIWWAPNNASKWQMGFNSAFKGLKQHLYWRHCNTCICSPWSVLLGMGVELTLWLHGYGWCQKMRSLLFWDVASCRLVIGYGNFGTVYGSHHQGWQYFPLIHETLWNQCETSSFQNLMGHQTSEEELPVMASDHTL